MTPRNPSSARDVPDVWRPSSLRPASDVDVDEIRFGVGWDMGRTKVPAMFAGPFPHLVDALEVEVDPRNRPRGGVMSDARIYVIGNGPNVPVYRWDADAESWVRLKGWRKVAHLIPDDALTGVDLV